jgi:hypothetical protein
MLAFVALMSVLRTPILVLTVPAMVGAASVLCP